MKIVFRSLILAVIFSIPAAAEEAWVISEPVTLNEPADLGNVIVVAGGSFTALGVPEPGIRFAGHLWVIGDGEVLLQDSVIKFMSIYHGQYILVGADDSLVTVRGCDYQVKQARASKGHCSSHPAPSRGGNGHWRQLSQPLAIGGTSPSTNRQ